MSFTTLYFRNKHKCEAYVGEKSYAFGVLPEELVDRNFLENRPEIYRRNICVLGLISTVAFPWRNLDNYPNLKSRQASFL